MRTRPATRRWSDVGSPGSRARSMRACQVLRPRRGVQVLALALLDILPSTTQTASAPGISFLSRLNGWPARSPADASPTSSRMPAHGSGPMWFATPSSQWTCTTYSLPVSRRTCVKTLSAVVGAQQKNPTRDHGDFSCVMGAVLESILRQSNPSKGFHTANIHLRHRPLDQEVDDC